MKHILIWGLMTGMAVHAAEPDYSAWNKVLAKYVRAGERSGIRANLVRYGALAQDPLWHQSLTSITGFDTNKLASRSEKLAYWINVYNIAAVQKVLSKYPTKSIRAGGDQVWKETAIRVGGKDYSLDAIEHSVLRPMHEPRIHFAIVCASLSCPDLRREAYTAQKLEKQLGQQARLFITNKTKGVRISREKAELSAIFSWFAADFGNVDAFLSRFGVAIPSGIKRTELEYNWSLNE